MTVDIYRGVTMFFPHFFEDNNYSTNRSASHWQCRRKTEASFHMRIVLFISRWSSFYYNKACTSMKIDHRKTNRCQLVNSYWLTVSVNQWSIDSYIKLSANYIDSHRLLLITFPFPFSYQWKSMRSHRILSHWLLIDFSWYRFVSINKFINCTHQDYKKRCCGFIMRLGGGGFPGVF